MSKIQRLNGVLAMRNQQKIWVHALGALVLLLSIALTPFLIASDNTLLSKAGTQSLFLLIEFAGVFFLIAEIIRLKSAGSQAESTVSRVPARNNQPSANMLAGVRIKLVKRYSDDRGFFSEIIKFGEETFCDVKQTSYTETHPGVVKAFHWHKRQYDVWFPVKGNMQVVLYDMRHNSPTFGETQVVYAGENNPTLILIPPGVAHGYRVLGSQSASLFYHTSEAYDPGNPDEERIAWDDPSIGFDWTTKNK